MDLEIKVGERQQLIFNTVQGSYRFIDRFSNSSVDFTRRICSECVLFCILLNCHLVKVYGW